MERKLTVSEQTQIIQSVLGIKPKRRRIKAVRPSVPKVKVDRKWPCTKKKYEWFIKNTGLCVASSYKDMVADGNTQELTVEDILCDSVDNLLMCDGSGVLWYMTEKLDYDKRYAKDALYDQVYSEAMKQI